MPLARERHGQHGVTHCSAFAQCLAATARAFDVAAREARAQRNGAVHLVFVELEYFCGSDGAAEYAEYRARMKPARRQRRNEFRSKTLHHLISRRNRGNEFLAGSARFLGRRQRCRRHAGARVHQHAERVPLAARERHFGIGERGAALGDFLAADQDSRAALHALFFVGHELDRIAARLGLRPYHYRRQAVQRDAFRAVDYRRRQVFVLETCDPARELAAKRCHFFILLNRGCYESSGTY